MNDFILKMEKSILVLLLAGMYFLMMLQIVSRIFSANFPWVPEIVQYLLVWTIYIAVAAGVKQKKHVSTELLVNKFSPRIIALLDIFSFVLTFFFFVLMFISGMHFVFLQYIQGRTTISLPYPLPMYPIIFVIPLCGFISCIHLLDHIFDRIKKFAKQKGVERCQ